MAEHNELGHRGEKIALDYLRQKGLQVEALNWQSGKRELDIVLSTSRELIVVEVKTRTEGFLLAPEDAVDARKRRLISEAAHHYIRMYGIDLPVRFDIVSVVLGRDGSCKRIEHRENAFPLLLKRQQRTAPRRRRL
ncbi:YraN family protein [Porphyromonas loveana]|uniref:UPF0102 protein C7382_11418 n=4 Tax=Porphyromonas loveana TaxID=1884669 RepID=A0A2U1F849_9PORP|nr:YraN family protein [Porphyromonas loveana]PVZ08319.1 putative endonuclease [Porphyromonas loveana]